MKAPLHVNRANYWLNVSWARNAKTMNIFSEALLLKVCTHAWIPYFPAIRYMFELCLTLSLQLLVFPRITKLAGFRNTFRLGIIVLGVASLLLPFSNQITGPIPHSNTSLPDNGTAGSGMSPDDDETSGYCNYTLSVNSSFESSVNVNSVARVPIYVWFVLVTIVSLGAIGR